MKKTTKTKLMMAFAVLLGLAVSTQVAADDTSWCKSGHTIEGKNGSIYCVSDVYMTWWGAFSWCQALGMGHNLANWQEACPNTTIGKTCTNLNLGLGSGNSVWTAQPHLTNPDTAYAVNLSSGAVNSIDRSGDSRSGYSISFRYYALCK